VYSAIYHVGRHWIGSQIIESAAYCNNYCRIQIVQLLLSPTSKLCHPIKRWPLFSEFKFYIVVKHFQSREFGKNHCIFLTCTLRKFFIFRFFYVYFYFLHHALSDPRVLILWCLYSHQCRCTVPLPPPTSTTTMHLCKTHSLVDFFNSSTKV